MKEEACFMHVVKGNSRLYLPNAHIDVTASDNLLMKCGSYLNDWFVGEREDLNEAILIHFYPDILELIFEEELPGFLGNKEAQYELEKQEYLQAVLKVKEGQKTVDLLSYEQEVLQAKVDREAAVYEQLTKLFTEREQRVEQKYAGLKNRIMDYHKQIDEKIAYKQEVQEALEACQAATTLIQDMIQLVRKAKQNEEWGVLLNENQGINFSYIDDAQQISYKVKPLLQQLEEELEDVYKFKAIKRISKVKELKHFNEIYYDYLISDWIIRKKINSSINYISGVRDTLIRIKRTLITQQRSTEQAIIYLKKRMQELILDAAGKQ